MRINAPFELKDADNKGKFFGYVSVFDNVDLGNDVIEQGAFKKFKTTKDGYVRMLFNHNMDLLAGKAKITQDEKGLHVDGQLNLKVGYVRDKYEFMKDGTLDGMSVGFDILPGGSEWIEKDDEYIRIIKAAELWEGSIVPFGMNPEATIETVKTYNLQDIRELEHIAKKNGCSKSEAVAIASLFKKHLSDSGAFNPHGDHGVPDNAMLSDLKSFINQHMRN
ncbi:MAG: HK97 family phage prohead protease [Proteobacteria bacterium]|nr:MAG: HK97 family phage prohead protease [Pseudomonadota bacterium]